MSMSSVLAFSSSVISISSSQPSSCVSLEV